MFKSKRKRRESAKIPSGHRAGEVKAVISETFPLAPMLLYLYEYLRASRLAYFFLLLCAAYRRIYPCPSPFYTPFMHSAHLAYLYSALGYLHI